MHMLAVDSFTPRGEKSLCEIPVRERRVTMEHRRDDVFAAIQWLARQPGVDARRIAIVGYSHGGSTVLSAMDRTDAAVRSQALQPAAAIAYYPGCGRYADMWTYEVSAPLLLMIGELDDWTPAHHCERLHAKLKRAQQDVPFEFIFYPGSHHGFDGYGPLTVRTGLPTRSGTATVGGNPEARENSLRRMFDFLSVRLATPLALTHDERFQGHRYVVPAATDFAAIGDVDAVPLGEKGRARYRHYLGLNSPKAFVITARGGWYLSSDNTEAMRTTFDLCTKASVRCWLYAVDDRVVWSPDAAARTDSTRLQRTTP
jgi:dienelactone hydrolase